MSLTLIEKALVAVGIPKRDRYTLPEANMITGGSIETLRRAPVRTSPLAPRTETDPSVSPALEATVIHLLPSLASYRSSRWPLTERTSTRT